MDRSYRRSSSLRLGDWRDTGVVSSAEVEAPGVREIPVEERVVWLRLGGGRWWPGLQDAWRYLPASGDWAARVAFGPDQPAQWYRYKAVAVQPCTSSGEPPDFGRRP